MKENFEFAMQHVFKWEGGYSDDPHDPGRETFKGISRIHNPDWRGWAMVDQYKDHPDFPKCALADANLHEFVLERYKTNYWDILNLDEVEFPLDVLMMDTGVNMGPNVAKQLRNASETWKEFCLERIIQYTRIPGNKIYMRGWVNRVVGLIEKIKIKISTDKLGS